LKENKEELPYKWVEHIVNFGAFTTQADVFVTFFSLSEDNIRESLQNFPQILTFENTSNFRQHITFT